MEASFGERSGNILILEGDDVSPSETSQIVQDLFPDSKISKVETALECKKVVNEHDFDLVILDYDLEGIIDLGIIPHLKVKDNEPAVLIISQAINPLTVNEINGLACHRYVHKSNDWRIAQLGPALRQLMRIRKLEHENRRLVAQLTEAKMFLEEKNKRLDEFSATVAHDIRGPLGGVSMKLEYLLEKYGAEIEPRFHTLLTRAFDSTRRVIDIVQAMYNYAKLGSQAVKMESIALNSLVEEVINDTNFDEKLDIKIGIGELGTVWGSKDLLRRVFTNLLSNAVKYNDKTEIVINIGLAGIINKTIGDFAQVFVSDNGRGISAEDQARVFSIFQRGQSGDKADDGLGVGLSVVRRIVEMHYGQVTIESDSGAGSKFILMLPLEKLSFLE